MEEYLSLINEKLELDINLNKEELYSFYSVIKKYLLNRSRLIAFERNLEELNTFFQLLGYSKKEEIAVVKNWPAIIHTDKNDLFYKYLVMAKIVSSKNGEYMRDIILLNYSKDFMTSIGLLYARIMYLLENNDLLRDKNITRRKVLKITNEEFKTSYGVAKETLLAMYPFNRDALVDVLNWEENSFILNSLKQNGSYKR